eukprot:TRINITY_DN1875_c0_g1_i3.p1 TRINITY_DN1875_c0_g1~~TRINITY_DN1875_c0_g1_i3.p1  ORF type:complete len:202 (-),score=27.87 TRINITY_DN1875_c0_g1_i3:242-847(-)
MARCFSYAQLSSILVFLMVGFARSDLASDRNECATQLAGLATCLPYVQGESKTPTPDCCSGLKQVVAKSRKCVCILVKDRDDPNLGFKINATLALKLPGDCSSPFNATECIDLLHLAPNSSQAQVFKQFQSSLEGKNSTTTTTNAGKGNSISSSGSSGGSSAAVKSGGASDHIRGKRRVMRDMIVGVWTCCLVSLVINIGG